MKFLVFGSFLVCIFSLPMLTRASLNDTHWDTNTGPESQQVIFDLMEQQQREEQIRQQAEQRITQLERELTEERQARIQAENYLSNQNSEEAEQLITQMSEQQLAIEQSKKQAEAQVQDLQAELAQLSKRQQTYSEELEKKVRDVCARVLAIDEAVQNAKKEIESATKYIKYLSTDSSQVSPYLLEQFSNILTNTIMANVELGTVKDLTKGFFVDLTSIVPVFSKQINDALKIAQE